MAHKKHKAFKTAAIKPSTQTASKGNGTPHVVYPKGGFYEANFPECAVLTACKTVAAMCYEGFPLIDTFPDLQGLTLLVNSGLLELEDDEEANKIRKATAEGLACLGKFDPTLRCFWLFFFLYNQDRLGVKDQKYKRRCWRVIVYYFAIHGIKYRLRKYRYHIS